MPYLVLEYMAGSDLCSYLSRRGRLPLEHVRGESAERSGRAIRAVALGAPMRTAEDDLGVSASIEDVQLVVREAVGE